MANGKRIAVRDTVNVLVSFHHTKRYARVSADLCPAGLFCCAGLVVRLHRSTSAPPLQLSTVRSIAR